MRYYMAFMASNTICKHILGAKQFFMNPHAPKPHGTYKTLTHGISAPQKSELQGCKNHLHPQIKEHQWCNRQHNQLINQTHKIITPMLYHQQIIQPMLHIPKYDNNDTMTITTSYLKTELEME